MKARIGVIEKETFVANHIIQFENGLLLKTKEVLWIGKEESDKVKKQFEEVVDELRSLGIDCME